MHSVLAEYRRTLFSRQAFWAWVISSTVLTLTGPFGTFTGQSLGERALYWPGVVALSFVIGFAVRPAIRRARPGLGEWTEALWVSVLFTAVYAPLLYAVSLAASGGRSAVMMHPALMAGVVFLVPLVVTGIRALAASGGSRAAPATSGPPRLVRRLDCGSHEVMRISGRNHYVDVFTPSGKSSLLMRFSDALDELDGAGGLRVHRSHWVARKAIVGVERQGPRLFLVLYCGNRIPVSRGYKAEVEASGFLDDLAA